MFSTSTKMGKVQITETTVGILKGWPLKGFAWEHDLSSLTRVEVQKKWPFFNASLSFEDGREVLETMPNKLFEEFISAISTFSTVNEVKWIGWYSDICEKIHVSEYKNNKDMQREAEKALNYGWSIQDNEGTGGNFSLGKAAAGGIVLGPVGLLLGTMGTKKKKVVTYTH